MRSERPPGGRAMREIQTTVVGSYPIPDWLPALPSQQALRDATAVVFHTQELAGIDLVADGELYRFDVNHPGNERDDRLLHPPAWRASARAVPREELRRFAARGGDELPRRAGRRGGGRDSARGC